MPETPTAELEGFLDFLYAKEAGLVYAPLKNTTTGVWSERFFTWPDQRTELVQYVVRSTAEHEVYIGPALYNNPKSGKESIKGSNVVWTEYDGNSTTQSSNDNIPPPSYRIQSSILGHEHFYWRLDRFETDISSLENINRAITYTTNADASAWDITQILRPPATTNHKHNKPVLSLVKSEYVYNKSLFSQLVIPPVVIPEIDVTQKIDPLTIVAKYKWGEKDFEHFRQASVDFGFRSSSLMRLGHICAEMRMSDLECYSILDHADKRWGKFTGRHDRDRRIFDIINKARLEHPDISETTVGVEVYDFEEMLSLEFHIEWIIEGILQRAGHVLLSGPQGIGKTQISLRFAMCMAVGKPFLGWDAGKPQKIIFVSMEMGKKDLNYFLKIMAGSLDENERKLLKENFHVVPLGVGLSLDTKDGQQKIQYLIDKYSPDGIFFDSLGVSTEEELTNESVVKSINKYTATIREEHDLFVWFIHHNRKAQATNKKPNKLSDIYGSIYVTSQPTTVLGLWPNNSDIEVSGLKIRLSELFPPFIVKRTKELDFERSSVVGQSLIKKDGLIEEIVEDESERSDRNGLPSFE